jgi:hypothetical protein
LDANHEDENHKIEKQTDLAHVTIDDAQRKFKRGQHTYTDTMLAPRKTLWSTPDAIIDKVIEWVPLEGDTVCDIGCGDGRVILQWASAYSSGDRLGNSEAAMPSFVGIDIDADRIKEAEGKLEQARADGRIDPRISISFNCANALEATHLFPTASVFFLYLIPRGLRKIKPLLLQAQQDGDITVANGQSYRQVRVITYMSPLPDETPTRHESISVPHQPGASWPLYLYSFHNSADIGNGSGEPT